MNPNLATWEIVLVGMLAVLLVMWFMPGIRASMKRSQEKQVEKDWRGVLLPLLMVALFVIVLIMLV